MSLQIAENPQDLTARSWVETQFCDRSREQGFDYSVGAIMDLIWSYLPFANPTLSGAEELLVLRGEAQSKLNPSTYRALTGCMLSSPTLSSLFRGSYDATFSSSITSFEEANIFLLGERHSPESSWRQLNGRFITHLSKLYPLIVFVESTPSMIHLNKHDANLQRRELQINSPDSNIDFFGWDLNHPIMGRIIDMLQKFHHIMAEKQRLKKIDKVYFFKEIKKIEETAENLLTTISNLIIKTFPARTQAMVSTLQVSQKWSARSGQQAKFVFVAGVEHLREVELQMKEYCLDSLRKELRNHKAVLMIPTIHDPFQP